MLIVVGFAQKSGLWQQFMPISHRSCQVVVAMSRVCLGRLSYGSHSKLWQSLCPPNKSDPGISQPTLMLFKYSAWFPIPSEHLTRAANVPNAQSRGGIRTYGTIFACLCHRLSPKSKWHVPPPDHGFACCSCSQLCQSLCRPNESNPTERWEIEFRRHTFVVAFVT